MQTLTCGSQWPAPRLDTGLDPCRRCGKPPPLQGNLLGVGALPKAGHSRDTTRMRGALAATGTFLGWKWGTPREGSVCSHWHKRKRSIRYPMSRTNIFLWYTLHISFDRPCCISHLYKSNTLKTSIGQLNINRSTVHCFWHVRTR